MLRRQPLLSFLAVLSTVPFATSDSTVTLTVPTSVVSITSFESIASITLQDEPSIYTRTERGREVVITSVGTQVVLSTVTEASTIIVPSETVLITTISHSALSTSIPQLPTSSSEITSATRSPASTTAASFTAKPIETINPSNNVISAPDESPQPSSSGLSAGSKAGIAVGTIVGALLLISMAYFCLKARSEARPRSSTLGLNSWSDDGFNTSPTVTRTPDTGVVSEKHLELENPSPRRDTMVEPEEMIHPAYISNNRFSNDMKLTGIVFENKDDQPMYVGVPTHLTGGERWSTTKG